MRKVTKQRLIVLVIVLIFGLSSIAFIANSFTNNTQSNQVKPLTYFVIEGDIDQQTEAAYYNGGFTFMKVYTNNTEIRDFVATLPNQFQTSSGQTQLIVQRYDSNESYIKITNTQTTEELAENITQQEIIKTLCSTLLVTPLDCALMNANLTG